MSTWFISLYLIGGVILAVNFMFETIWAKKNDTLPQKYDTIEYWTRGILTGLFVEPALFILYSLKCLLNGYKE